MHGCCDVSVFKSSVFAAHTTTPTTLFPFPLLQCWLSISARAKSSRLVFYVLTAMLKSEREGGFEQTDLQDFEANRSSKRNHGKRILVEMETCSTSFIDFSCI